MHCLLYRNSTAMDITEKKMSFPLNALLIYLLCLTLSGFDCDASNRQTSVIGGFNVVRQKRDLIAQEDFGDFFSESQQHPSRFMQTSVPPEAPCSEDCLNGGVCTQNGSCDCSFLLGVGNRCQIVPSADKAKDGICKTWGQYHFETFDGSYYYFPGHCSYIFAKDCSTVPQYTIWVHNSRECNGSVYECKRSVSMFFENEEEIKLEGHMVTKAGARLNLPQTIQNVFIERLADYILVKTTFGFSLAWDRNSGIYIKLTEEHKGRTCGLCGNFNGNRSDDLTTPFGMQTEDIAVLGNSWSIVLPQEAPCAQVSYDFPSPCSRLRLSDDVVTKCLVLAGFPFFSCHESVDPFPYIASCINDLCISDDDETYCRAVTEYGRACSHAGYPLIDWKDDFPACTDQCDDDLVHRDCISCCPPTCTFEKECLGSNLHCLDGCYCQEGLIMQNGTCIPVTSCPCIYHGVSYPLGTVLEQECSTCTCTGGLWNCTDTKCSAECSITGNSHVATFDGRHFTFLGNCQYILVQTDSKTFTMTLQNMQCDQYLDQICIQSVSLILEEDVTNQITITKEGKIHIGVNEVPHLPYADGNLEIRELSSLFIQVKTIFGLQILSQKGGERLYIQVTSDWKERTMGLCGTFNGNLRDDFLSPAGMIEGTPQLHANAWKLSSACISPVNVPIADPCDMNQQNALYAAHCDVINQDLFVPCHSYVSPVLYYHWCHFDACKCGRSCVCTVLAHYAHICAKHGIVINFRSHVSYCGVVCLHGTQYNTCSTSCGRACRSLSAQEVCSDDCIEGCNCPDGKYFDEILKMCVWPSKCHCHFLGGVYQQGEFVFTQSGPCQCTNGRIVCPEPRPVPGRCPEGQIYYDCLHPVPGLPAAGLNCQTTCANLAMNLTCPPQMPCQPGCICPPGWALHNDKCYIFDSCPCVWKGFEYSPSEIVSTSCYNCVCQRGVFKCINYLCPAVCTVYGDRHYHTFDGMEFDYASDCQVVLVKSTDDTDLSVHAKNNHCYENDIVCSKDLWITVGDTEMNFMDGSSKPIVTRIHGRKYEHQLWKAGFYTAVYYPELDIVILWDKKTTLHITVGPRWKGRVTGLCGNFDNYTSNDMTTYNNMEVRNAQVFGDSWTSGWCKSQNDSMKSCEVHHSNFPYAKKQCALLYSDVFAPCRNVIDVTWFVKNCHSDTCNCNLGGDCECLCTSIAVYAHKCCQQGVKIQWRSQSVCPYDCDYYNRGLGEGPYVLVNYAHSELRVAANITSRTIFPLPRISTFSNVVFNFMITPGLFKDKNQYMHLISFESAERPNYFLYVQTDGTLTLKQWEMRASFRKASTFFHHQNLWIPGYSAFELYHKKGFFIMVTTSSVKAMPFDYSEEFRCACSFSIEGTKAAVPYRRMCEWRYEPCSSPCIKTCHDPEGVNCKFLPPVEGCFPYCPKSMILDEVTLRCVYPEDCVKVATTPSVVWTRPQSTTMQSSRTSLTTQGISPTQEITHRQTRTRTTAIPIVTHVTDRHTLSSETGQTAVGTTTTEVSASIATFTTGRTTLTFSASATLLQTMVNLSSVSVLVSSAPQSSLETRTVRETVTTPVTFSTTTFTSAPTSVLALRTRQHFMSIKTSTTAPSGLIQSTAKVPRVIPEATLPSLFPTSLQSVLNTSVSVELPASFQTNDSFHTASFLTSSHQTAMLETTSVQTATHEISARSISLKVRPTSQTAPLPVTTLQSSANATALQTKATLHEITTVIPSVESTASVLSPLTLSHFLMTSQVTTTSSVFKSSSYPFTKSSAYVSTTSVTLPSGITDLQTTSSFLGPSKIFTSSTINQTQVTYSQTTNTTIATPAFSVTSSAYKTSATSSIVLSSKPPSVPTSAYTTQLKVESTRESEITSQVPVHSLKSLNETFSTQSSVTLYTASVSASSYLPYKETTYWSATALPTRTVTPSVLHTPLESQTTLAATSSAYVPTLQTFISSAAVGTSETPTVTMKSTQYQIHSQYTLSTSLIQTKDTFETLSVTMLSPSMTVFSKSLKLETAGSSTLAETSVFPVPKTSYTSIITSRVSPSVTAIDMYSLHTSQSFKTFAETETTASFLQASTQTYKVTSEITASTYASKSQTSPVQFLSEIPKPTFTTASSFATLSSVLANVSTTARYTTPLEEHSTSILSRTPESNTTVFIHHPSSLFQITTQKQVKSSLLPKTIKVTEATAEFGFTSALSVTSLQSMSKKSTEMIFTSETSSTIHPVSVLQTSTALFPYSSAFPTLPVSRGIVLSASVNATKPPEVTATTAQTTVASRPFTSTESQTSQETTKLELVSVLSTSAFSTLSVTSSVPQTAETQVSPTFVPEMTTGGMPSELYHYSFSTEMPTPAVSPVSPCVPSYMDRVDECSQYICINMQWKFYNASKNCPNNVTQPDCGFRGMPIQKNKDECCPEWECPCLCTLLSDLSIITFDGNNAALYNVASYVLVSIPGETIVVHIEKCSTHESPNSIRRQVLSGGIAGLCFNILNITTGPYKILINHQERKVKINALPATLPFTKKGLLIEDTGTMYTIITPAGVIIHWTHRTSILDVQYGLPSIRSNETKGLCGCCNGNPADDLKMSSGMIVTSVEYTEEFVQSWEVETSGNLSEYRRKTPENCTNGLCDECLELLNNSLFAPCHSKVPIKKFCEELWITDAHFRLHTCDTLTAYVGICNKHNICINWRTLRNCPLKCPAGQEYQPCVSTCTTKTCLNKDYYVASSCSYLREECVCGNGTVLHRTYANICVEEKQCACTDHEGNPHSVGEIWNGSDKGCCMYQCLENGTVSPVEPNCSHVIEPACDRLGEFALSILLDDVCCPRKICECNVSACNNEFPICEPGKKMVMEHTPHSCCPTYKCVCDLEACPTAPLPECKEDQFTVEVRKEESCCFSYLCVCESCIDPIPLCSEGEIISVDPNTTHRCCPQYYCACDEITCPTPELNCTAETKLVKKNVAGQCCPKWHCECNCENIVSSCGLGEKTIQDPDYKTVCNCTKYICKKDDVCIFQDSTLINPGESLIQHLENGQCNFIQCFEAYDPNSGFHVVQVSIVNCTERCEPHQVYIPSSSPFSCCGKCRNLSCTFENDNGSVVLYKTGATWTSNCTIYECTQTMVGAVTLTSNVVCPPFNENECVENGGTVEIYDGCCKTCSGLGILPFTISPVFPTDSYDCEKGSGFGRLCQKVTVRLIIRRNDCKSLSQVNIASCDGKCPSATIFNFNVNSHLQFCKCCRENGLQNVTVPLYCAGNKTFVEYNIQEPTDCSCQWN
ncbi:otogelin-like protein [Protopterus annectens]|uniref:otogelin-like protein n=1 Tax=Protopterus annectens TaxID=7888 RepID=UPI001CFA479B|nr:otogelin-like protein [Protopterus annectens]